MDDNADELGRRQALETRTVLLFGELSARLAQTVSEQLLSLAAASGDDIRLVVSVPGGTFEAAEALFDLVRGVGAPVNTIGAGAVAGAGALVYASPPRERRFSLPHARYSLYQTFEAPGAGGDVLAQAQFVAMQRQRAARIFAAQTGQPDELVERDIEQRHWLSAEEARQYGLVGQIGDFKLG